MMRMDWEEIWIENIYVVLNGDTLCCILFDREQMDPHWYWIVSGNSVEQLLLILKGALNDFKLTCSWMTLSCIYIYMESMNKCDIDL